MDEPKNIGVISQEKFARSIEGFEDYFKSGDAHDILTLLGDISKANKAVKLVIDFRNWYMLRKIRIFVETLDSGKIDEVKYQQLCKKYGQNRVMTEVLVRLDRFGSEVHAKVLAHLMAALINGRIDWDRFCTLSFALELLNPQDIESYVDESHLGTSFITAGLAYMTYTFDGVAHSITPNGKRFIDFYSFGLGPYLDSKGGIQ